MTENDKNTAILSSEGCYTVFKFGKYTLRFRAPYSLERYIEVKIWDRGYIAVMTKYSHSKEYIEEYIDLVPTLKNLYIDVNKFLEPIKGVKVSYE